MRTILKRFRQGDDLNRITIIMEEEKETNFKACQRLLSVVITASNKSFLFQLTFGFVLSVISAGALYSQDSTMIIPRRMNPLCYISVPFQNNFDLNVPPNNGFRWTMNLMPIIPISLGKKLEITTRVVLPIISQTSIYGNTNQTGMGDLLINTFLTPKSGRLVWGVGPSFYFPTGFPQELSAKKWAVGPGIIAAWQGRKLLTAGLLFHIWSFAGSEKRPDFSYSYFQPLMVYSLKHGWGLGLTAEIGLEWETRITNGSVIFTGQKLVKIGKQFINFVLGPKVFFGNFNIPGFGFRATVNLLFP
ncbi:MAG: hypothetical protein WCK84_12575 [Bacteroidota bacterium]